MRASRTLTLLPHQNRTSQILMLFAFEDSTALDSSLCVQKVGTRRCLTRTPKLVGKFKCIHNVDRTSIEHVFAEPFAQISLQKGNMRSSKGGRL